MVSPASLFRMLTELIFVLLGGFLVWLGLSGRVFFDPRRPAWLGLCAVLIYWGARAWLKTTRAARTADRTVNRIGAGSLIVIGCILLSLAFVELRWAGIIMALAGVILTLRGLAGAGFSLRSD
jgi:hypothetical protein